MRKAGRFIPQLDIRKLERFDAAELRPAGPAHVSRGKYPVRKAETRDRVVELERPYVRTGEPVDGEGGARKISPSRSADGQTHGRNQVLLGVALGRYVVPFHLFRITYPLRPGS